MVVLPRLPSLVYSSAARILSPYEYMNYILVVEVLVRTPVDQFWAIVNTTTENWTLLVDFDGARIVRDDGTLVVFRDARDAGEPALP